MLLESLGGILSWAPFRMILICLGNVSTFFRLANEEGDYSMRGLCDSVCNIRK